LAENGEVCKTFMKQHPITVVIDVLQEDPEKDEKPTCAKLRQIIGSDFLSNVGHDVKNVSVVWYDQLHKLKKRAIIRPMAALDPVIMGHITICDDEIAGFKDSILELDAQSITDGVNVWTLKLKSTYADSPTPSMAPDEISDAHDEARAIEDDSVSKKLMVSMTGVDVSARLEYSDSIKRIISAPGNTTTVLNSVVDNVETVVEDHMDEVARLTKLTHRSRADAVTALRNAGEACCALKRYAQAESCFDDAMIILNDGPEESGVDVCQVNRWIGFCKLQTSQP